MPVTTDKTQRETSTKTTPPKAKAAWSIDEVLAAAKLPSTSVSVRIGDHDLEVTIRALASGSWQALLAEHQPSLTERRLGVEYTEGFPPAALAACAEAPAISVEQARKILSEQPMGTFLRLWGAVLQVNLGDGKAN